MPAYLILGLLANYHKLFMVFLLKNANDSIALALRLSRRGSRRSDSAGERGSAEYCHKYLTHTPS
jgi:hypothetical protein